MKLVDLSRALENAVPADPPGLGPRIEYSDHQQSLPGMLGMFPGLTADRLPGGEAWAVEMLTVTTHNGTHVDAPWHFASTTNRGERAWTIDEVPLDWFYRPGMKLDFRDMPDGHVVTAAELEARVASIRLRAEAIGYRVDEYAGKRCVRQPGVRGFRMRLWA